MRRTYPQGRHSMGCWGLSGVRGVSMIGAAWYEVSEPEWGERVPMWERGSSGDKKEVTYRRLIK